ncbi:MAG: A24 family peptidase C-terminal domain-containing protein [Candidatus Bathyarchaeota archaeon]|jgi:preflagellin peptidase FlaK|nr:A24 family peptidase C-terminal domain-containing protein [Candidatus Bathyarchaeota archaeon]
MRVLLSLTMLGYSSWVDLKTRELYDMVWLVFGGVGLIIAVYEVYVGSLSLVWFVAVVLLSAALSLSLSFIGLFGGADALAFITLAILHPFYPRGLEPLFGIISPFFPLTLFSNSVLAGASYSLVLLIRNLALPLQGRSLFSGLEHEPFWRKLVVLVTGLRVGVRSVRGPPFQYPLEMLMTGKKPGRMLILIPDLRDDSSAVKLFKTIEALGVQDVWVSNTLPFIVYIAIGYILALEMGDVIISLVTPFFLGLV